MLDARCLRSIVFALYQARLACVFFTVIHACMKALVIPTKTRPALSLFLTYSAPALVLAFAGMPLYIHAPDFYATEYSVSLSLMGAMLLVLRLLDAVIDPAIGYAMDRFAAYRFAFMMAGLGVLGGGVFVLFHPVPAWPLVSFGLGILLATLAFSAVSINLNSLGAGWLHDAPGITHLTTTREAVGLLGLICAVTLPSLLMHSMSKSAAFHAMSLVLLGLTALAAWAFAHWHRQAKPARPSHVASSFWRVLRNTTPGARLFFGVYGLSMLASSLPAVLVMFFIRDRLGAEPKTGLFLLLYFLSGALAMPLWQRAGLRFGVSRSWAGAMMLACASFVWAYSLGTGQGLAYGIICVLSGVALGGELAMPPALLTQLIQQENEQAHSGTYFSVMAFLLKVSLALAAAFALPFLEASGFKTGMPNTAHALQSLSIAYALVPCLIKAATSFLLVKHGALFSPASQPKG